MADPFEENIIQILENRKAAAAQIVASRPVEERAPTEDDNVRLPYDIAKTVQYIKQDAYRKLLKQQPIL